MRSWRLDGTGVADRSGEEGCGDGGIASPETFFHWHGETFDLPEGAEWLAYSEKCRHQAYRYERKVYGLQFHPEVTAEMIEDWCRQPVNCGDVETLEGRSMRGCTIRARLRRGSWKHGSNYFDAIPGLTPRVYSSRVSVGS